jgi:hypothetical protein
VDSSAYNGIIVDWLLMAPICRNYQAGGLWDIIIPPYLLLQHFLVATPLWRRQRVNTISKVSLLITFLMSSNDF